MGKTLLPRFDCSLSVAIGLLLFCLGSICAERDFNFNDSQVPLLEPKDEPPLHVSYRERQHPYITEKARCDTTAREVVLSLVLKNQNWNDLSVNERAKVLDKLSKFFAIPKAFIEMESATKNELHHMQKSAVRKGPYKSSSNQRLGIVNLVLGCGNKMFSMGDPIANQIGQQMADGAIDNITGVKFGWWIIWQKDLLPRAQRIRRQIEGSGEDNDDDYDYDDEDDTVETVTEIPAVTTHAHRHHHGVSKPELTASKVDLSNESVATSANSHESNLLLLNKNGNIDAEIVESVSQLESVITKTIENTKNIKELPVVVEEQEQEQEEPEVEEEDTVIDVPVAEIAKVMGTANIERKNVATAAAAAPPLNSNSEFELATEHSATDLLGALKTTTRTLKLDNDVIDDSDDDDVDDDDDDDGDAVPNVDENNVDHNALEAASGPLERQRQRQGQRQNADVGDINSLAAPVNVAEVMEPGATSDMVTGDSEKLSSTTTTTTAVITTANTTPPTSSNNAAGGDSFSTTITPRVSVDAAVQASAVTYYSFDASLPSSSSSSASSSAASAATTAASTTAATPLATTMQTKQQQQPQHKSFDVDISTMLTQNSEDVATIATTVTMNTTTNTTTNKTTTTITPPIIITNNNIANVLTTTITTPPPTQTRNGYAATAMVTIPTTTPPPPSPPSTSPPHISDVNRVEEGKKEENDTDTTLLPDANQYPNVNRSTLNTTPEAANAFDSSVQTISTSASSPTSTSSYITTPTSDMMTPEYAEPKAENMPPMIKTRLQKFAITSGKSFAFTVPEETFYDNEDITNLRLDLTDNNGHELKPTSWLQFNAEKREIYGLPLDDSVSKWLYRLSATDSGNDTVAEIVEISVQQHRGVRSVNHEINIAVKINEKHILNIDWQIKLMEAIATTLGDQSTNSIVVREIRQTPQDPHTATFVYFNETLPTSACPEAELNDLVKRLDANRLSDLVYPVLGVKSITGQLIGSCQKSHITKPKPTTHMSKNLPPMPRNQVDRVNATVGHLLIYKVPSDTFYDPNDNELTLSLKTKEHKELNPRHWLQFDAKNQEFYGIPKSGDIGTEEYLLVAEDSGGLTATDALVVVVNHASKREFSVYFKAYLAIRHEQFNADLQRKFVERVAQLFGDHTTHFVQIRSVTTHHDSDGTIVNFYNTTLFKTHNRCPEEEIEAARSVYLMPDYMLRDRVRKALGPELNLTNVQVIPLGSCHPQTDITHREFIPTKTEEPSLKSTFADDYMFTFILPAVIIVGMILIASLIACCLHRRRRKSGKMELGDEEERKSFRTKGIPVIFQDELDEKPEIGNKSPIILKDEKPPLLPPSYNTSNMNGDNDVDEYVPPPAVVVGGREARGKSPATPSYRKPPPYVSP